MIGGALNSAVNAALFKTETFSNQMGGGNDSTRAMIVSLITVTLVFGLILFAGKFLWNNVLHELVPAIKPAKSVWQILGLAILISLLHPGGC